MQQQQQTKQSVKKRIIRLALLAAVCLLLLAIVTRWDTFDFDALRRKVLYSENESPSQEQSFSHVGGAGFRMKTTKSGLVIVTQAGCEYRKSPADKPSEQISPLQNPVLHTSKYHAVVYDAGHASLFLFDKTGLVFTLPDQGQEIISARTNDKGELVITAKEDGYKGSVTLYTQQQEKAFQVNLSSAFISDAAVSPAGREIALCTMGQANGMFLTTLFLYKTDKQAPEKEIPLGDFMVLDMKYTADCIWLVGQDCIKFVNPATGEVLTYSFSQYHLKGYCLDGDGFAVFLLGRYRAAAAELLITVAPDGSVLGEKTLRGQTPSLDAQGAYVAILSGDECQVFTKNLSTYYSFSEQDGARYFALVRDGSLYLSNGEKAWRYVPDQAEIK